MPENFRRSVTLKKIPEPYLFLSGKNVVYFLTLLFM